MDSSILPQTSQHAALPLLRELLQRAGFAVRSAARADCPSCIGKSRMTVAFRGDVFYCHRCKRTGSRFSLARDLGLLATDPGSVAQRRSEARQNAKLQIMAERLGSVERRVLRAATRSVLALVALRRNASNRLQALNAGAPERFPGELNFAWQALQYVWDHERNAAAAYLLVAFGRAQDRASFALYPECRWDLVSKVLEGGGVFDDRGRWVELGL